MPEMIISLADRSKAIDFLMLDVDGVLTDGSIVYSSDGQELKAFHVRDGSGLKLWHEAGKRSGFITGRTSRVVNIRAHELGIDVVLQGVTDKLAAFDQALAGLAIKTEKVCYVGDDLPDLPVLRGCGLAVAVADACPEVRAAAHYVTRAPGGRGAVREVVELLLQAQGRWPQVLSKY